VTVPVTLTSESESRDAARQDLEFQAASESLAGPPIMMIIMIIIIPGPAARAQPPAPSDSEIRVARRRQLRLLSSLVALPGSSSLNGTWRSHGHVVLSLTVPVTRSIGL
jgi:hypothetical protein